MLDQRKVVAEVDRLLGITEAGKRKPSAKKRHRGKAVFPAGSAKVTDDADHFPINCLSGETEIPMLDGQTAKIEALVGTEPYVYAYSSERRAVVPVQATNVRKTGEAVPVIRVVLDNGEEIVCTDHHLIMLRDSSYVRAGELSPGDSLMPCALSSRGVPKGYKCLSSKIYGYAANYEHVYQPFYQIWEPVHKVVIREYQMLPDRVNTVHIHHRDRNRRNNLPENLEVMDRRAHSILHGKEVFGDPEFRRKQAERARKASAKRWSNQAAHDRQSAVMKIENARRKHDPEYVKKLSEGVSRGRLNVRLLRSERTVEQEAAIYTEAVRTHKYFKDAAASLDMHQSTLRRRMRVLGLIPDKQILEAVDESQIEYERKAAEYRDLMSCHLTLKDAAASIGVHPQTLSRRLHHYGIFATHVPLKSAVANHRVLRVEPADVADVYDMEVPEYHNFGIGCGIFVHNSVAQARNALARANQYDKSPGWYKGSLSDLKKAVASAVKKAYPSIEVSKKATEGVSKAVDALITG